MRKINRGLIIAGFILGLLALVFFVFMLSMIPRSNDPAALMQTFGTVSGAVGGACDSGRRGWVQGEYGCLELQIIHRLG
jgi:hypothetical protein